MAYTTRNLGWVAVTRRIDDVVVVRHDARRVAPLAAERFGQWLEPRADGIREFKRIIQVEGTQLEARHDTSEQTIAALARVAFILKRPRRSWQITQLSLQAVKDKTLQALLRVHGSEPDKLVHAAASMGAFTTSSVLAVSGEDVVSLHAATAFDLNHRYVVGHNVMARADTEYAIVIRDRVLRAHADGPNYFELTGSINNWYVHYLSVAIPEPGPDGRVLTSSVLLDAEYPPAA